MRKVTSILLAIALGNCCAAQTYAGPKRIGPFHIDRNTPSRVLFKNLGMPVGKRELNCYQAADRKAFLYFEIIHTEPENVGDVFISDFPNCRHMAIQTANSFRAWKTSEGIGIGSSEVDVLRAYGQPSSKRNLDFNDYRVIGAHIVRGYRRGDKLSRLADYTLSYRGDISKDLSAAEFGVLNGKVTWIRLSQNE